MAFYCRGVPAVAVGVIAAFYLADYPSEAVWLPKEDRSAIVSELAAEHVSKRRLGLVKFRDAFKESRLLLLLAGYFFYIMAIVTNTLWMPTFIQRLSHLPAPTVARLVMIPAAAGVLGLLVNSWNSDKSGERKWHTVVPIVCAGFCYMLISVATNNFSVVMLLFTSYYFFATGAFASLWAIPTTFLSHTTAAAAFGLINSVGQMGGSSAPRLLDI